MDLNDIRAAAERIKPYVKRTPLERSRSLSERLGTNIYIKYELFQRSGSFKPRGAFNKLLSLTPEQRAKGVVAVSGGNHAQAVAYSSSVLGVDAVIVMPENTPKNYLDATRGYGATIDLQPTIAAAFSKMEQHEAEGRVMVHPFDDPLIVAGAGTVGLEIYEDLPAVTDVITSIGGGGLAGGVALALRSLKPDVRAWGVETHGADAMAQALDAGKPVTLPAITSIAKTLGAPFVTDLTLNLAREQLESVTVVDDADAVREILYAAERLKVITEPATACTVAAAAGPLKDNFTPESHVAIVFCGGNTSIPDVCGYMSLL